ncbi:hypothetical protein [Curtobacterium sp. MMLR14_010]|uniref:hypothetical protein n=1 Tax=Curtobacterium sp. MMLR14_010 TaxID=1898743 RepID=UPI0009F2E194|nr:hypothetical protein [Curtobacterium sp. MMLR14_010]
MTEILEKPTGEKSTRRPKQRGVRMPVTRVVEDQGERSKQQRRGAGKALVIGGVPRVDLLPTEVLIDRRQRTIARRAWLGVVVVGVATVLGVGAATVTNVSAEQHLRLAQSQSTSLLQQQGQYSAVRDTEARTGLVQAGQAVGGSTEIDWSSYLQQVQDSLPTGVTISGIDVDSASPLATYAQASTPLEGARVATLGFEADSPTLPSVPDWLDRVHGLPGFVDANVDAVTLDETTRHYTVNMTVHIDDSAFDGRYSEETK